MIALSKVLMHTTLRHSSVPNYIIYYQLLCVSHQQIKVMANSEISMTMKNFLFPIIRVYGVYF